METEAHANGEGAGVLGLVEAGLASIFPGAVVVDRGLRVGEAEGEPSVVELVAVDGEGRLLLVSRVVEDGTRAVVAALDALAFARENLPLFARHFHGAGLDAELAPLVVLAAERFEPSLIARLGGIDPARVTCLEIRRLASLEREAAYLVPVVPASSPVGTGVHAARPYDFLQQLLPELRSTAERLIERLARIDDDLAATTSGRQMRFALDGEPICALQAQPDALEARVIPDGGTFRIATRADADAFLEEVLQRALELFEPRGTGSLLEPPPRNPEPPPLDPEALREAALDPLMPSGAILTAEEIEAFRQMR